MSCLFSSLARTSSYRKTTRLKRSYLNPAHNHVRLTLRWPDFRFCCRSPISKQMATPNATVMSVDNPSSPGSVASPSVKTLVLNDAATANGVKPGAPMKPGLKGKNEPQASTNLEAEAAAAVCAQPTKTPVSVLQELCVKRQITPKYDLIQIEGSVHEPTFKYRVTVGEYIEHGTGQSKKKAKHAAAKAVLDKLVGNAGVLRNGAPTPVVEAKSEVLSPYEDGIPGNPVGNLQEFCMSRRLPPPVYELSAEDGLPHERLFTIDCIIGSHRASGSGKSKKLAKRQAAYKLLQALRDVQPDDSHGGNLEEEDDEGGLGRLPGLKDAKISVMNPAHSAKLLQFHKSLMVAKGEKITALKTMSLAKEGFNYAQFLQELAREQNFEVTFVDIEEMSKSGKYQCLVQLSTLPVAVCYGSGTDQKLAQEAAAHNALEYLKVMAK